jgi:hypothetical protein
MVPATWKEGGIMKNSVILAAVSMLALGVIAVQSTKTAVATVEPQMVAQTITPFGMMQNARGLPVDVNDNAI